MNNQIIVVEGIHDQMRIQSIYKDAHVVITHGREISKETIEMLKTLGERNDIILLLDPDGPGEKIRSIISAEIPKCRQAFIPKYKCISKNRKKVGIEHATNEDIICALENLYEPKEIEETIQFSDLYDLMLIGQENSMILRDAVSLELNIGKPNAKTFLKRVNLYGISKSELYQIVTRIRGCQS